METEISADNLLKADKRKRLSFFQSKKRNISEEDRDIVIALNHLSKEMNILHLSLDSITDPDLIDAYIYEIKAVGMRYKYYLGMCKEKGIIADVT